MFKFILQLILAQGVHHTKTHSYGRGNPKPGSCTVCSKQYLSMIIQANYTLPSTTTLPTHVERGSDYYYHTQLTYLVYPTPQSCQTMKKHDFFVFGHPHTPPNSHNYPTKHTTLYSTC